MNPIAGAAVILAAMLAFAVGSSAKRSTWSQLDQLLVAIAMVLALAIALVASASADEQTRLPPQLSGTWCYDRPMGGGQRIDGDVYERSDGCAHDGGFTIWPNGQGRTNVRFDEVNNSCKFEKVERIKSSSELRTGLWRPTLEDENGKLLADSAFWPNRHAW